MSSAEWLFENWGEIDEDSRFYRSLSDPDDLVCVLRCHLLFELRLEELLLLHFPDAAVFIGPLRFDQKIQRLFDSGAITADVRDGLKGINWVRNRVRASSRSTNLYRCDLAEVYLLSMRAATKENGAQSCAPSCIRSHL